MLYKLYKKGSVFKDGWSFLWGQWSPRKFYIVRQYSEKILPYSSKIIFSV